MRIAVLVGTVLVLAGAAVGAALTTSDASAKADGGTLRLVAYSTPREAYAKLIDDFRDTSAGRDTSFEQSYGASGEQARAVINGLRADVVAFSLEPDMTSLVKTGWSPAPWLSSRFARATRRRSAPGPT
jgi:ABC-type sulfate transport system substrate-binding protein